MNQNFKAFHLYVTILNIDENIRLLYEININFNLIVKMDYFYINVKRNNSRFY